MTPDTLPGTPVIWVHWTSGRINVGRVCLVLRVNHKTADVLVYLRDDDRHGRVIKRRVKHFRLMARRLELQEAEDAMLLLAVAEMQGRDFATAAGATKLTGAAAEREGPATDDAV